MISLLAALSDFYNLKALRNINPMWLIRNLVTHVAVHTPRVTVGVGIAADAVVGVGDLLTPHCFVVDTLIPETMKCCDRLFTDQPLA